MLEEGRLIDFSQNHLNIKYISKLQIVIQTLPVTMGLRSDKLLRKGKDRKAKMHFKTVYLT